jgi:putative Ca2+/H+ antiporter (TMEM165/GDT1 family)
VNLAVAATTFILVIPAELPDKTFISSVVLASRHRPLPVWTGASAALVLQAALAVVAGHLLGLLPHVLVESIISAAFIGGALYLLFVPQKAAEARAEEIAAEEEGELERAPLAERSFWRITLTTFTVIALAEFGDITQVLIANLTARYRDGPAVFVGASVAFLVVAAVGVLAGRTITRWAPISLIRKLSGLALLALGIYTIVGLATG